jgi:hypothetical protein
MNLIDGGVSQRSMRNGWFVNANGIRIEQKIVVENGRSSKGIERVLRERRLWDPSCNLKQARKLLSERPDFLNQPEWLEEPILNGVCMIDFYPKYHCQFNLIEVFWGA